MKLNYCFVHLNVIKLETMWKCINNNSLNICILQVRLYIVYADKRLSLNFVNSVNYEIEIIIPSVYTGLIVINDG